MCRAQGCLQFCSAHSLLAVPGVEDLLPASRGSQSVGEVDMDGDPIGRCEWRGSKYLPGADLGALLQSWGMGSKLLPG